MIRRLHAIALAALVAVPGAAQAQRAAPTTVILVRHAEKLTSNPAEPNPGLTPAGLQRARDLATALRNRRVSAIITTDLARTRLTAVPTAQRFHVTPEEVQAGGDVLVHARTVADRVRAHPGQTVLVVGHSNTVAKIIAALGGPTIGDICDDAYSNLFTLVIPPTGTPRLTHGHYGAADPAPDGHTCVDGVKQEHHAAAGHR
ncbi:MAG TPA: histidine phosphatase family protein [Longimicrobiaceae bacterium]|nr:histidine phosphatase family protein [Longimicrobiaceae bacterium]